MTKSIVVIRQLHAAYATGTENKRHIKAKHITKPCIGLEVQIKRDIFAEVYSFV